ncbi:hypothetical protein AVEN_128795-1 [Araneus ventricosus]|uniref:RNase H type-1 domain-containing protein n=1 Tax=Araneus ventricosus TaxID=182803 RepID=A0A4Y2PT64_ARAVE|nr:hypothetical protein AVEN_232568-1 [Araneus ventricosus]GBN55068.1 hypothetical protein AVEN_244217-1 [Araneus ventricosus]GBN55085.1 hypothetical protein AVEN_270310-1 [Araneus ventricosus]GBN55117.1 hypothetical protein AVEN_128795-1 [Araneus ventricosus]
MTVTALSIALSSPAVQLALQMVGKTARLQYSFPSGTSGLETRNRVSPANHHPSDNQASVQAAANPRSRNVVAIEICKSLITNKHMHIFWIKAHVG